MRILISLIFLFFTTSSFAVTFNGKFVQGSFIIGKTEAGSEVFIDKKKVKVTSDGFFVDVDVSIIFRIDDPLEVITTIGPATASVTRGLKSWAWDKHVETGLRQSFLTP